MPDHTARGYTEEKHRDRHRMLHSHLDELVADFINNTKKVPSESTVMELMEWSAKQIDEEDEL